MLRVSTNKTVNVKDEYRMHVCFNSKTSTHVERGSKVPCTLNLGSGGRFRFHALESAYHCLRESSKYENKLLVS
jgi:hypothetical protein